MGPPDDEALLAMINTSVPNVARVYDYLLGGKDNFGADRELADRIMRLIPDAAVSCRLNREFLGRAVRHLAQSGISQFLDIGSGLPTRNNVHQVAQQVNPGAQIVYVDNDRIVTAHARALMQGDGVHVIEGDLRKPLNIIDSARGMIDFSRPVAVLMFAILHFITDSEWPGEMVSVFKEAMIPGSCLALSHITDDSVKPDVSEVAQETYRNASAPAVPRSHADILKFFSGLTLLGPGLVPIHEWPARQLTVAPTTLFYGGVGIKDEVLTPN